MADRSGRVIRGVRSPIRERTLLGRVSPGDGPVEMVDFAEVVTTLGVDIQTQLDSISTTQGAVLYRNATDWVALPPGTNGQVLTTAGAAANPSWTTVSADIQTLLDGISTTQGVIIYYNGTDWVALAPGTSGYFLKTQGAAANPVWASVGVGSSDQILTGFSFLPVSTSVSSSANAFKGHTYIPNTAVSIHRAGAWFTPVDTASYKIVVLTLDGSNVITAVSSSSAYTGTSDTAFQLIMFSFSSPVALAAGTRYAVMVGRTDSTDTYSMPAGSTTGDNPFHAMPGRPITFDTPACTLADADPATTLTVTEVSGSFAMVAHFTL